MIRRWVPYPGLAIALVLMWLLLTQSFSLGQLLLGSLFALIATWAMTALRRKSSPVRDWPKVFVLLAVVSVDILRSNLAVARIILTPAPRRTSAFIQLRLQLRDPHGLAILALIITATPGTAWVQFDRTTGVLMIHVFDLIDEDEWIKLLKTRYEYLLMAIFES